MLLPKPSSCLFFFFSLSLAVLLQKPSSCLFFFFLSLAVLLQKPSSCLFFCVLSLSLSLWQCCYRSQVPVSLSLSLSLSQCCFRSQAPVFTAPRPQRLRRRGAPENFPEYFYGSERGYYSTQKIINCYVIDPRAITGFSCRAPENNLKMIFSCL